MNRHVRDIMRTTSLTFTEQISIGEALAIMREHRLPGVPYAARNGNIAGVISREQLLEELVDSGDETLSVRHCVERRCLFLEPDQLIEDIWNRVHPLNIVMGRENEPLGIVEQVDVLTAYAALADYRQKELDAVVEFAHNGIVAVDHYGTITTFNPAAEKISKVPREKALGKYVNDVLVPTGLMEVVRTGKPRLGEKYRVGKRWYFTNRTPIVQDGMIKGGVAVFQDISEIEKISHELVMVREIKEELETILQTSYDGVLVMNADGEIIRANHAFMKLIGPLEDEVSGRTLQRLMADRGFSTSFADLIKLKSTVTTVEKNEHTGQVLGITMTPIEADSSTQSTSPRYVVNVRNMSELTELRQELDKTRVLTQQYKEQLKPHLHARQGLIAESKEMQHVLDLAYRVASVDSTVLILGESGVGKEEIASYIHQCSPRHEGPFIKINCGAIPEHLLESELFGYEAGAFTGAHRKGKPGLLEAAHEGTVLLDEIADMPLHLQVKLLRFLQDSIVTRVGSVKGNKVDVRIIAATNKDIAQSVEREEFREDLYFRLNVVPIHIPPLRKRRADILPLINQFVAHFSEKYNLEKAFSPEALKQLLNYHWPGNVREMMNVIERCLVTAKGRLIGPDALPDFLSSERRAEEQVSVKGLLPLREARDMVEQKLINEAIRIFGTTYKAAEALEVDQSTVVRKMKKFQQDESGQANDVSDGYSLH